MTIVHIVLFGFKPDATPAQVAKACADMLNLANTCLHPETKKPYIRSTMGGKNNSKEGLAGDTTHAFVMWFESEADRDYYVEKDPAHQAFKQSLAGIIQSACVVDFETGVF
ncbi:uncharacterized protein PV09_07319 [Verruconis gallopava]|uniref:Stress-response A/B barrel domain-containing protein n=1 Tax=Verruconis gallopava TaxID=253628 RepID=A0A0D2A485_9PEZI|nr:uncharacterized protein PV09_07319 [Verruconis gallopava]KIW01280.1 hypothetical protein PV09_07319 [Verruconis gallopava]